MGGIVRFVGEVAREDRAGAQDRFSLLWETRIRGDDLRTALGGTGQDLVKLNLPSALPSGSYLPLTDSRLPRVIPLHTMDLSVFLGV